MSEAAVLPHSANLKVETNRRVLVAGIGFASFASLLLELALTRLFSVVLFYHFAFLAISVALLGLGAGGVFAYQRRAWLARWTLRRLGVVLCGTNAVVILLALEVVLHVPVKLDLTWSNFERLSLMYLAAAVPFLLTGVLFSSVFARESRMVSQLYSADLVGGAFSCLVVVPLLNWLGGPNAVVFAALAMAGAAIIWADARSLRRAAVGLSLALIALLAVDHSGRLIDIVYAKGERRDRPWMLFARWSALSRVEVDQVGSGKCIVIDADASTAIMNVDPAKWGETQAGADQIGSGRSGYNWKKDLMSAPPAIANVLRPQGAYAIIGPGGGVDVLRAVASGSPHVTGIEINPLIANTIMRGLYADYSYHLYELPQVRMHVAEGRSWLRSSREKYDVVQMTLVDTWASTAAGAFALSENNLYTVEAFREYFDHLRPEGFIAITRWEFRRPREALRVVAQAIEALEQTGVKDVRQHFIVVADGQLDEDGRPVTVLAKKTPFTQNEEQQVLRHVEENTNLYPLYSPTLFTSLSGRDGGPSDEPWINALRKGRRASGEAVAPFQRLILPHNRAALGNAQSRRRHEFVRNYPFNIAPVSDNAPFFFFTFKAGEALRNVIGGSGRGMDWKNNLGVVVLGMVLVISLAAVLAFLIGPLVFRGEARGQQVLPLLYFVALGLSYILVEIALIQRFVLFLGHPTYALTVVVFLTLLASGLGSASSRQLLAKTTQVRPLLAVIALWVGAYILVMPRTLGMLVGLPFPAKLLLSAVLVAPLGFAMGMPFPTGLRQIAAETRPATCPQPLNSITIEWAWAMNAASSVLGSVLAMVVAIEFGLSAALAVGAATYVAAMLLTFLWRTASTDLAKRV